MYRIYRRIVMVIIAVFPVFLLAHAASRIPHGH